MGQVADVEDGVVSRVGVPSFEEWVDAHADALTRFAVLVLGDRTAADDAVQEALARTQTHRALKTLRAALEEQADD